MGVTLERVQFKFASIIGELCSEPDILSQFAVWVDLRLAEYKLKGSISLDCSGETPDPIWLQGILSALLAQKMARQKTVLKPSGHNHGILHSGAARNFSKGKSVPSKAHGSANFQSPPSNRDDVTPISLSPVIKEEPPDDGVYPVTFHVHEVAGSSRKRSVTETITSQDEAEEPTILYSHSTPKQRRSDASGNMDNESLMSIIGIGEHSNNGSTISSDIIKNTTDRILQSEEAASVHQDEISISQQDTPLFSVQMGQGTSPSGNSGMGLPRPYRKPTLSHKSHHPGTFPKSLFHGDNGDRLIQEKLNVIYRSERSRINNFERFIRSKPYEDFREISSIPPDELSSYLAKFFLTVKTQSGGEFSKASLVRLRTSLERHLKEHDYPCSITLSPQFALARIAFKKKLLMLKSGSPSLPSGTGGAESSSVEESGNPLPSSASNELC